MSQSLVAVVEAQIASGKTKLPVFDGAALRLQQMLVAPPDDTRELSDLLASDPVIASAVLRLANSSIYGGLTQVSTIQAAVSRLGLDQVTRLALVVTQQQSYRVVTPELSTVVTSLWKHTLATALGCQWVAKRVGRGDNASEAFLSGMLHDIGKLLVIRVFDDLRSTRPDFRPTPSFLTETLASLHAKYGGTLARGWHLPESYLRAIEHHHDAELKDGDWLLAIVRLVDQTANGLGYGIEGTVPTQVAATREAQILGLSDIAIAELEIHIEDASGLTQSPQ